MRRLLLLGLVLAGSALIAGKGPSVVVAPAPTAVSAPAPTAVSAPAPTALSTTSEDPATVEARVGPEPRGRPVVVASTPASTAAPVAATAAPAAPSDAPPARACAPTFFCYPRLGIAGPITAYDDCSGVTDVGAGIRQLTCVPEGIWLAGHAYTQFGRLTGFRMGDVVFVRGQQFSITGSSVQRSCAPTTQAVAPLSLQTSLESTTCGRVLVVQGG